MKVLVGELLKLKFIFKCLHVLGLPWKGCFLTSLLDFNKKKAFPKVMLFTPMVGTVLIIKLFMIV